MLNERGKLIQKNTKFFDKVFIVFYILFALTTSIIAGFDAVRYEWSKVSFEWIVLGIIIYIIVSVIGIWAMAVNPHFETTVRIQNNREHKVCISGPYKIVRHPGYAAFIIASPSYSLILGSFWGLVPTGLLAILFIVRTVLEDQTLQEELAGYKDYAKIVRWRLVPFVW